MTRLTVETDNIANAKFLASFLKNVTIVKSVVIEKISARTNVVQEPAEEYNWINPSRPATDEEIEQMLSDCEAEYKTGKVLTIEEAEEKTRKKIDAWKRKNSK